MVKRDPNAISIKKFKNWLFWETCDKCKIEFVREFGWSVIVPPAYPTSYKAVPYTHYFCGDCFKKESDVYSYIHRRLYESPKKM